MEGLGKPVNQLVTPSIFGYNKSLPEREARHRRGRRSCWPTPAIRTASRRRSASPTTVCPATARWARRSRRCWRRIGIDVTANAQPAAVFFPARTRGDFSMSMSGWGTLTGEAHYTLSSIVHSNDPDKKLGRVQRARLQEPADGQADPGRGGRDGRRQAPRATSSRPTRSSPRIARACRSSSVGSAWAMQKDKVTIKPRVDEDTLAMNIKPAK